MYQNHGRFATAIELSQIAQAKALSGNCLLLQHLVGMSTHLPFLHLISSCLSALERKTLYMSQVISSVFGP